MAQCKTLLYIGMRGSKKFYVYENICKTEISNETKQRKTSKNAQLFTIDVCRIVLMIYFRRALVRKEKEEERGFIINSGRSLLHTDSFEGTEWESIVLCINKMKYGGRRSACRVYIENGSRS